MTVAEKRKPKILLFKDRNFQTISSITWALKLLALLTNGLLCCLAASVNDFSSNATVKRA